MITIIDLGISNIKSITRGFVTQGFNVIVTQDPEDVSRADSLVLPGVGAFPRAVEVLKSRGLWDEIIRHAKNGKPLLGVCLGMQLLFDASEEYTLTGGLGLVKGTVRKFPEDRHVPHMGWNEVEQVRKSILFNDIPDKRDFYFVHSYFADEVEEGAIVAYSDYHGRFVAAVQKGNIFGTQFHPEKSQRYGLMLLRNFALLTEKG